METKFAIRKKDVKDSYIELSFNNSGNRFRISTGILISNSDWKNGFPIRKASTKHIVDELTYFKKELDKYINMMVENKERRATKAELKSRLDRLKGKETIKKSLKELYEEFLEEKERKIASNTYRNHKSSKEVFMKYAKNKQLYDIDLKFGEGFKLYLDKQGLQVISINCITKDVKVFLNWLMNNDYTEKRLSKYFTKEEEIEKEIIALDLEEVAVIEQAVFSDNTTRFEWVRDIFLFSCYTGLRFGDVARVRKEMIDKDNILTIRCEKTKEIVDIPLLPFAQDILMKYNYKLPVKSEPKTNKYLKEMFKHLGLGRMVMESKQYLNRVEEEHVPLYDAITFHSGRKTFVTVALVAGMPAKIVMSISGHKKDANFQKYINFSKKVKKNAMLSVLSRPTIEPKKVAVQAEIPMMKVV